MALQAFIDDSYDKDRYFVLAGYISTQEKWNAFSSEWEQMLPHGTLDKNGNFHFKMSEMAINEERMERAKWFYSIIEKHVGLQIASVINTKEFENAKNRVKAIGIGEPIESIIGKINPYDMCFHNLAQLLPAYIDELSDADDRIVPEIGELLRGKKIDFFFDEQSEKEKVLTAWENWKASAPLRYRKYYGKTPIFGDDKDILPLQAADLAAWWTRKAHIENGNKGGGKWIVEKTDILILSLSMSEDTLTRYIAFCVRKAVGGSYLLYDTNGINLGC